MHDGLFNWDGKVTADAMAAAAGAAALIGALFLFNLSGGARSAPRWLSGAPRAEAPWAGGAAADPVRYGVTSRDELMARAAGPVYN